jgi:hypothetical protein
MTQGRLELGLEDAAILPVVVMAVAAKNLLQAALSILIHILDYAFPILLQLMRFPLFTVRIIGDCVAGLLERIVGYLPVANRDALRECVRQHWSWLKQKISYKAFEESVHHAFEAGMAWVFKTCSALTPRNALLVVAGAIFWLPASLIAATAMHAALIREAASLPAWMQLLHPVATFLAKSKLLVLPIYPAAWPQAKTHPCMQAVLQFYHFVRGIRLVQKIGYRYRQTEWAVAKTVDGLERAASFIGLNDLLIRLDRWTRWIGSASRIVMMRIVGGVSRIPLIGSIVKTYAMHYYESMDQRHAAKLSEKVGGSFERWSMKLSARYYETKRHQTEKQLSRGHDSFG